MVQSEGPQYTELFRMPQHSTMLRIISKICGREGHCQHLGPCLGGVALTHQTGPVLTMMTATTMAAIPMRYSFPEKSSSIF